MQLAVEISLYPLKDGYVPDIKGFIQNLKQYDDLVVKSNAMSTQICGEFDRVMNVLKNEIRDTFEQKYKAAIVCKFLNSDIRESLN